MKDKKQTPLIFAARAYGRVMSKPETGRLTLSKNTLAATIGTIDCVASILRAFGIRESLWPWKAMGWLV